MKLINPTAAIIILLSTNLSCSSLENISKQNANPAAGSKILVSAILTSENKIQGQGSLWKLDDKYFVYSCEGKNSYKSQVSPIQAEKIVRLVGEIDSSIENPLLPALGLKAYGSIFIWDYTDRKPVLRVITRHAALAGDLLKLKRINELNAKELGKALMRGGHLPSENIFLD